MRVAVPPPAKRSPLLAWAAAGLACGATVGTLMFVEIRPASVDSWIEAAKESLGIEAEAGNNTASPEGTKTDPKSEKTPAKKR